MHSVFNIADRAIQNGFKDLAKQAQKVAELNVAPEQGDNLPETLVQTKMTGIDIEAMVKVLKAADETLGALLDVKA